MATIKLTGRVLHVGEKQTYGEFMKQPIVVEETEINDNGTYINELEVEFVNKNLDRISQVRVGDMVEVSASVRSREGSGKWDGRWFTNVNGFFCRVIKESNEQQPEAPEAPENDLPF